MIAPLLSPNELERIVALHHQNGTAISLATGCFDVLHVGHIELLESAAERGTLFVGLNTDESVRLLKGHNRPVNTLKNRAKIIAALRFVNAVFAIEEANVAKAITAIRPTAWIKGADYTMETLNKEEVNAAKAVNAEIVLFPFRPGYSSTTIIQNTSLIQKI